MEVDRAAKRLKDGRRWKDVFPNLAALSLDASGTGQTYTVRLTKEKTAPPVRFAETEDESENAAIMREVDVTERYPFSVTRLAELSGVTTPKAGALIWKLGIKEDPDSFHEIQIGKSRFPRYSHKALKELRSAVSSLDIDEVWKQYRAR